MIAWLSFYFALSVVAAGVLLPILRSPQTHPQWIAPEPVAVVPLATFDPRGFS